METMFNLLLGNDEAGRKRHISEHGKEYLDQLDLHKAPFARLLKI